MQQAYASGIITAGLVVFLGVFLRKLLRSSWSLGGLPSLACAAHAPVAARRAVSTAEASLYTFDAVERCLRDFETFGREVVLGEGATTPGLADSFDAAVAFVRAICEGIASFGPRAKFVKSSKGEPVLELRPNAPLHGDIATRSRIPYNIRLGAEGLSFRLSRHPPDGQCPFHCACHANCFGPVSCSSEPWAELTVELAAEGARATYTAVCSVFRGDLDGIVGARLVEVPENKFDRVDLRGAAAVLSEKHKPQNVSDGSLTRAAKAAGACCVVKVGGSMLCTVPEPMEIPCVLINDADGRALLDALQRDGASASQQRSIRVASFVEHDRRTSIKGVRWGSEMLWVHMTGFHLQTIDWDDPLVAHVDAAVPSGEPLIYEDFYGFFERHRGIGKAFSPERSKFSRMLESAYSQLRRFGLATNPAMMGKILALGGQRCQYKATYLRFSPAKKFKGTTCTMLLSDACDSANAVGGCPRAPAAEVVHAWVAHEVVYLAIMSTFNRMIGFIAPSLWNFIKCVNGEYFGWECDSTKIVKLFTASSGPMGPHPSEHWQQNDPTWRIVDEKNAFGIVTTAQGRVLWTEQHCDDTAAPERPQAAKQARRKRAHTKLSNLLSRMGRSACGGSH